MTTTIALSHGDAPRAVRDDAFAVRRAVFMDEQGYENEFDAIDDAPACIHVTIAVDGACAGCARVFPEQLERSLAPNEPQSPACAFDREVPLERVYLLGRVAVLPDMRRRGLASELIRAAEQAACKAGARVVKLHAQEYVQALYEAAGYEVMSDVDYEDEGQPHVWMAKRVSSG